MKYLNFIWKKSSKSNIIFCAFILPGLFFLLPVYSQIPKPCGDPKVNMDAMQKAERYAATQPNVAAAPTPVLMRVYFHILRNDDGTNAAATEAQIQSELNQLQSDYA